MPGTSDEGIESDPPSRRPATGRRSPLPWPSARLLGLSRRVRRGGLAYKVLNRVERTAFTSRVAPEAARREDLLLVRLGGHLRLVVSDPDLDVATVARRNLDLVVEACRRGDVPYFLIPARGAGPRRVGVSAEYRGQLLAALTDAFVEDPVYASVRVSRGSRQATVTELTRDMATEGAYTTADVITVYQHYLVPEVGLRFGGRYACEVEFWQTDPSGTLLAARSNRVTTRVPLAQQNRAEVVDGGRRYETLAPFARPLVQDVTFPVDVVYTWVDGGDPRWQARKDSVLREHGREPAPLKSVDASRFRSHDELRYSMRSLAQFAPWVRHVYLVTDDQVPDWLDQSCQRLTVVDHKELFRDIGRLPTFNSHAIASRLHHIEGLSEHYLLLNDDVLFGRPVSPELFFLSSGMSKFFLSKATVAPGPAPADEPPHESARRRTSALIEQEFGRAPTQAFKHTPVPQQRSLLHELEERYPEEFATTASNQFRHATDLSIASWLHHYYGYFTRRAVPGAIAYDYFKVTQRVALRRMSRLLRRRYADCFCLNDFDQQDVADDELAENLNQFLTSYLPFPSEFEKDQSIVHPDLGFMAEDGEEDGDEDPVDTAASDQDTDTGLERES